MATAKELRLQARECIDRSRAANEYYVRVALVELARRLARQARQAERRESDLVGDSNPRAPSAASRGHM
jgi:hypothetical protein